MPVFPFVLHAVVSISRATSLGSTARASSVTVAGRVGVRSIPLAVVAVVPKLLAPNVTPPSSDPLRQPSPSLCTGAFPYIHR